MSWAFELLGLRPDADAVSVKRAYARLLRTTRPDEDPEAFQRLHAAYKTALAQASARPVLATEPNAADTRTLEAAMPPPADASTVSRPSPSASPHENVVTVTVPRVDLNSLANEVVRQAVEAKTPSALRQWLQSRQEFWSIQAKQQIGHLVLQRLFQQPQAMSPDHLDALLHFFDLDHVLSGINPIALQKLRSKQTILWELMPDNHHALAQRSSKGVGSVPAVVSLRKNLALLQRPFRWPRALLTALHIRRAREIGDLVRTLLGKGGFEELPPAIDREHTHFWYCATAKGMPMPRQRFIADAFRISVAALITASFIAAIVFLGIAFPVDATATQHDLVEQVIVAFTATAAGVFGLWLLFVGCVWFDYWQGFPEYTPSRRPWLRRLAIPALCTLGVVPYVVGGPYPFGWIVALSFFFAVRKFRRRAADRNHFLMRITSSMRALIWIGIVAASALSRVQGMSDSFIPFVALVTFAILSVDFWQNRAYVHPKLARNS